MDTISHRLEHRAWSSQERPPFLESCFFCRYHSFAHSARWSPSLRALMDLLWETQTAQRSQHTFKLWIYLQLMNTIMTPLTRRSSLRQNCCRVLTSTLQAFRETNAAEDLASTVEIHEEHHQYLISSLTFSFHAGSRSFGITLVLFRWWP